MNFSFHFDLYYQYYVVVGIIHNNDNELFKNYYI